MLPCPAKECQRWPASQEKPGEGRNRFSLPVLDLGFLASTTVSLSSSAVEASRLRTVLPAALAREHSSHPPTETSCLKASDDRCFPKEERETWGARRDWPTQH